MTRLRLLLAPLLTLGLMAASPAHAGDAHAPVLPLPLVLLPLPLPVLNLPLVVERTPAAGTPMVSAATFLDSVGVNVHLTYRDTQYSHMNRVSHALGDLGVRHIRDGAVPHDPRLVKALRRLGREGVTANLIIAGRRTPQGIAVDRSQISMLHKVAPYLSSVEDPNELDCSGDDSWIRHLKTYGRALKSRLQSDSQLDRVPILGPSFCKDNAGIFGSVGSVATVANAHDYTGGQAPELALEGRTPRERNALGHRLPFIITETGYNNALRSSNPNHPVTEEVAADYELRTLLTSLRGGVRRTYLYELFDEHRERGLHDIEQHFGLVRFDGSHKPAYTALRNLMHDLTVPGMPLPSRNAGAQPMRLAPAAIAGGGSLVRSVAIADPHGSGFTLATWLANPETAKPGQEPGNRHAKVTLALDQTYAASVRQPSGNNRSRDLGTARHFSLDLSGKVSLVHLVATPPPAGTSNVPQTCRSGGFAALARRDGATTTKDLGTNATWSAPANSDTSLPDRLPSGTAIERTGVTTHVPISFRSTSWTIALWEKTSSDSASYADYLNLDGTQGGKLRTYDLDADPATHQQLDGYGLPNGRYESGIEMFGQALPNTWHLVSLSSDGDRARFSIDGVPRGSVASSAAPLTGMTIGSLGSGGFRGSVGSLAVFPSAISPLQLLALATVDDVVC